MNKIAIIDLKNYDVGLKILFPEAEYFILEEEYDKTDINNKYNINPIVHNKNLDVYEHIEKNDYDCLFIVAALYDCLNMYKNKPNDFYKVNDGEKLVKIKSVLSKKTFKKVCFIDNYDYDYDPNIIFENSSDILDTTKFLFFKRNFNKEKKYKENVYSFPYIIFGHHCNIDMLNDLYYKRYENIEKIPRIFFSGQLFTHIDDLYEVYRYRLDMYKKILNKIGIHNPGYLNHTIYMSEISKSKYSLDLHGVGDPNRRTFEILSCGSLLMRQKCNLKWPFDDEFCEETIFNDENEFLEKIIFLENNPDVYNKCLQKQKYIVENYMNIDYLRNYLKNIVLNSN